LIPVTVYAEDIHDEESWEEQHWCPECVAEATAEEFTALDPKESSND
jgi:hypothetical protein